MTTVVGKVVFVVVGMGTMWGIRVVTVAVADVVVRTCGINNMVTMGISVVLKEERELGWT